MPKPFHTLNKKDQIAIAAIRACKEKYGEPPSGPALQVFDVLPVEWSKGDWQVVDRKEGLAYLVTGDQLDAQRHELTRGETLNLLHRHWRVND